MITRNSLRAIVISDPPDATAMCNALQKSRVWAVSCISIAVLQNKAIIEAIITNGNAYIGMPVSIITRYAIIVHNMVLNAPVNSVKLAVVEIDTHMEGLQKLR